MKENGNGAHEAGQKRANAFGLYDTLGNAWEWVNDWFSGNYYQNSPSQDPTGPAGGQYRIVRGGSWGNYPGRVRVSLRNYVPANQRSLNYGFRCGLEEVGP
jgi:formylglycine-generating enzyme required for sulfatase activity